MRTARAKRIELALVGLGLLLGVGGCLAPGLVRALSPQTAVDAAWWRDRDELRQAARMTPSLETGVVQGPATPDPWGRPWRVRRLVGEARGALLFRDADLVFLFGGLGGIEEVAAYSLGRDGTETDDRDRLYPRRHARPSVAVLVAYTSEILWTLAAVAGIWALCLWRFHEPRLQRLVECVALMTLPPVVLAAAVVDWAQKRQATRDLLPGSPLALLPAPLALVFSFAVVVALLALALRLATQSDSPQEETATDPTRVS